MKPSAALLFSAQGLVASIWDLIGGNSLFAGIPILMLQLLTRESSRNSDVAARLRLAV